MNNIFEFLEVCGRLKFSERFTESPEMPRESVGAHSWRLALLVMTIHKDLKLDIDLEKSMKLAVAHDLVESISEDIDYCLIANGKATKEEKYENEKVAIEKLRGIASGEVGKEICELWNEYANRKTKESRFVYALDKIEGLISLVEAGHTAYSYPEYLPNYANESVAEFPELSDMLVEIKKRLKAEFEKGGIEWKDEYDSG
ncbi:MAG: HD domain-containing protein [Candidatus Moranbacteria bacterium]|nr:HD domain-containing protein [Candidatus Moranbacteria bacterium]